MMINTSGGYDHLRYRNYDPVLGRMQGVDPKAVKYASLTPYNYAGNNPVFWNDPLGDDYYESNRLYNLAMEGFRNTYVASQAPRTAMDPGGGGYFNNWINANGGGASWTPGGGWTELKNGQALEAGINYNNRHHSWSYTALNNTGASTGYGAGTFLVNYNGGNFGGNYHTENGKVVSVAIASLVQANNGGWFAISGIEINVFGQSNSNTIMPSNGWSDFWSGFTSSNNTTYYGSASNMTGTAGFWIDGVGSSIKYSARTATQISNATRVAPFFKTLGFVGNIAVAGLSYVEGSSDGNVSAGEWFKVGSALLQAGLVFTPVGWGVLAYNGVDFLVGITTGTSVTDRIANGIDSLGK